MLTSSAVSRDDLRRLAVSPASTALGGLALVLALAYWAPRVLEYYNVDFSSYWAAAKVAWRGGSPYRGDWCGEDGASTFIRPAFKYPPSVLPLLLPLAFTTYRQAKVLWLAAEIAALLATLRLAGVSLRAALWITAALVAGMRVFFFPLWTHVERGQAELLVLVGVAVAWWAWRGGHEIAAGAVLAAAVAVKPPAVLLFAVPLMERRWRFLAGGAAGTITLLALSSMIVGVDLQKRYWLEYFPHLARTTHLPPGVEDFGFAPGGSALDTRAVRWTWDGYTYRKPDNFSVALGSLSHGLAMRNPRGVPSRWDRIGPTVSAGAILVTLGLLYWRGRGQPDGPTLRAWRWSSLMVTLLAWHPGSWVMTYVWLVLVGALAWRWPLPCGPTALVVLVVGVVLATVGDAVAVPLLGRLPQGLDGALGVAVFFLLRRVSTAGLLLWGVIVTRQPGGAVNRADLRP
jgi:hypothetical protein